MLGLWTALLPVQAATEPAPLPLPDAATVLSTLRPSHPRLFVSAADWPRLREAVKTNELMAKWQTQMLKKANAIVPVRPARYEIPDGLRLLAKSRQVLDRVSLLALEYHLTQDARFAQRAWVELNAAAQFPDWNNSKHFLDTAEMTHAFALGYDWLYDFWTPEQRQTLRAAILAKGLQPGLEAQRKKAWWAVSRHNWNQVCNGGLAIGALAVADTDREIAGEVLNLALTYIQLPMAEFAPDGAWGEGPGYWDYATIYNVAMLAALDTALGTDFGLSTLPAFAETGAFPLYLNGPSGKSFNYADGGDHYFSGPQLFWLARKFNRPEFCLSEYETTDPSALDMIWLDAGHRASSLSNLALDRYFRKVELAVFRSEWLKPEALYAGLKAGDNAVNHSHLDLGSFVLDALGERWAVDFGKEDYNLPGYFGKQRWTYYRLRAEGHNTLVLNPGMGPDQASRAVAPITRFESRPERAFAITDLTTAYAPHAEKVRRGLAMLQRKAILVQDEVQSAKGADLWWFMHTAADIQIDGTKATLRLGNKTLTAQILAPTEARFTVMPAEPLPNTPHPEKQANNAKYRKLAIHLPAAKDTRVTVLLAPSNSAINSPSVVPLDQW